MINHNRTQLDEIMDHIEEMWSHLDVLFDALSASDGWEGKHGADWTFADLPYHLAYCNRDIVIRGIEAGAHLPEEKQELLATPEDIHKWNARKFSERLADQSEAQSVAQWRATCDRIRHLTAQMSDVDLEKPFWMPLFSGWTTALTGLEFCRSHDWSEFTQLRIHMGQEEPMPSANVTKAYLKQTLSFFPMFLNAEMAAGRQFSAVMAFTDPGIGAYTIRVTDGMATVKEGDHPNADLMMMQSATTYEKTLRGILNPVEAIQSGLVQVNNFESLATFGELFPMT